ncbi:MAG: ATP-grasp domain-containing protein [Alphaproteobacteria bacterium]|nr:ATP-grasp domain-containing protein [Alphaproteobacteria bacterium]
MQDTLLQLNELSAVLEELGHGVGHVYFGDCCSGGCPESIAKADLVFNLVEDIDGRDELIHIATSWLDAVGVPYTGNRTHVFRLVEDKRQAKKILEEHRLPTPLWFDHDSIFGQHFEEKGVYIVKSSSLHGSVGIDDSSIVSGVEAAVEKMMAMKFRFGGDWFAESYVDGREINVSMLEIDGIVHVLPIAEILFENYHTDKPKIVGYAAKWEEESEEYNQTPRSFTFSAEDRTALDEISQLARRCWDVFGLHSYARVDFRMDHQGKPWVIDVNPNPCLMSEGGFMVATRQYGLSSQQVMEAIGSTAMRASTWTPLS